MIIIVLFLAIGNSILVAGPLKNVGKIKLPSKAKTQLYKIQNSNF